MKIPSLTSICENSKTPKSATWLYAGDLSLGQWWGISIYNELGFVVDNGYTIFPLC